LPSEINNAIICLYIGALIFFLLGIYLNEVIAGDYGVKKNWLFCLKREKTTRKLSASNIEKVLLKEDPDSQKEKQFVSQMN